MSVRSTVLASCRSYPRRQTLPHKPNGFPAVSILCTTAHSDPRSQAATFSGEETIDVILDAPSKTITLNAAEIKFGEVKRI